MKYNSVGEGPFGKEVFLPGSFGDLSQSSILLNIQHDRSRPIARTPDTMTLSDSNSALVLVAKPPPTREVQDAKLLVAAGILQGLSIEFNCKQQEMRDGIRVVSRAELVGGLFVINRRFRRAPSKPGGQKRGRCSDCVFAALFPTARF